MNLYIDMYLFTKVKRKNIYIILQILYQNLYENQSLNDIVILDTSETQYYKMERCNFSYFCVKLREQLSPMKLAILNMEK